MEVPVAQQYRLGIRLAHALMTFLLVALYVTGLRLAGTGGESAWFDYGSWPDRLLPGGRVHLWHVNLGLVLIGAVVLYAVHLLVSGHAGRLLNLFTHTRYRPAKKLLYLLLLAVVLIVSISGISLYAGLYEGPEGYAFQKAIHHRGSVLLLLMLLAHGIEVAVSRTSRVRAIFLGPAFENFAAPRPLLIAAVVATVATALLLVLVKLPAPLAVPRIPTTAEIDGVSNDAVWEEVPGVTVPVSGGINLEGGATEVTLRGFHNSEEIYFLLQWADPDPSYNRQIVKTDTGWIEQKSAYLDVFGETIYWEDALALWFSRENGCEVSCHLGGPRLGQHITCGDTVDIWHWRAVSTNPVRQADDTWWGGDPENEPRSDPQLIGGGGPGRNLDSRLRQPLFGPGMDPANVAITPSENTWSLFVSQQDTFALGTTVPSVIAVPFRDDRADIAARGVWSEGVWTLELRRNLRSSSPFDQSFYGHLYMGLAPFSNAQRKHAYHLRPIRLDIQ
jgi:hypothetical protein